MSVAVVETVSERSDASDMYSAHGSLERMTMVATRVWDAWAVGGSFVDCQLDDLRAALHLMQRGWHRNEMAIEVDVGVEWELVEAIRAASR